MYDLDTTILRYFHVYGPRQEDGEFGGVVAIFARKLLAGLPLVIFGDGTQERSFTSVDDVVTANLKSYQLVNGSRGVVIGFRSGHEVVNLMTKERSCFVTVPVVRFLDGREIDLCEHTWEIDVSGDLVRKTQIPLTLAWALTIHKSQGMSLDYVVADVGDTIFEYGQLYVVLSRARTLEGLSLKRLSIDRIMAHPKVVEYDETIRKEHHTTITDCLKTENDFTECLFQTD